MMKKSNSVDKFRLILMHNDNLVIDVNPVVDGLPCERVLKEIGFRISERITPAKTANRHHD